MKVLMVNEYGTERDGMGGVEMHIPQLQQAMQERGVQTALLAQQLRGRRERITDDEFLIKYFNARPLRKHPLRNYRRQQTALQKAVQCIKAFEPDVIHVHNLMNPWALRMLRACGPPIIKSIHDCRPFCVKPLPMVASRLVGNSETFCDISFGKACWRRCYAHAGNTLHERVESWSYFPYNLAALREIEQANHLVVYSRYLKELALLKMKDPQRIHVVHHFTDAEFATEDFSSKPRGKPVFLFAGRLSPEKGVLKIFDALERIPHIACKLTIAGDGPIRNLVQQRIQCSHPRHKIEMMGYLDQYQLYEQYRSTSVLLFPSIGSEGCPLVGIEAMYFGATAIGFNTGGVEEWLIDGKTGILLPSGDIDGLAIAIAKLAADPQRIAVLGQEAQRFVRQKFTCGRHIDQLIAIYQTAIRQHHSNTTRGDD